MKWLKFTLLILAILVLNLQSDAIQVVGKDEMRAPIKMPYSASWIKKGLLDLARMRSSPVPSSVYHEDVGVNFLDMGIIVAGETRIVCLAYLGNGVCLAGTGPANGKIARSIDYGITWADLGTLIAGEIEVECITYCGNGICLAGTQNNGHIARSVDYGATWADLGITIVGETKIQSIAYLGNGVCLAGTFPNGKIARSVDYGATWADIGSAIAGETYIWSIAYLGNGVCIAGTGGTGRIARSTDYGATWTDIGIVVTGLVSIYKVLYLGNGVCLASGNPIGNIARSIDYGATWIDLGAIVAGPIALASMVYLGNGVCLAGTIRIVGGLDGQIVRSTDYGRSWTNLGITIAGEMHIYSLVYLENGVCLVGTGDLGKIARSDTHWAAKGELSWTLNKLLKGAGVGAAPTEIDVPSPYTEGVRVYNSANISIPTNDHTALTFDSERYDTDTIHDLVTNPSRLTCKTAGKYLIISGIRFDGNVAGYRVNQIRLNGATLIAVLSHSNLDIQGQNMIASTIYDLAVDDYVEAVIYQNTGGDLNVTATDNSSPEFMMHRIG